MKTKKYRAWDKEKNEMIYDDDWSWFSDVYMPDIDDEKHNLMESTDFPDKNGNKIYGNDILEIIEENDNEHGFYIEKGKKVVVVWVDDGFKLFPLDNYNNFGKEGVCDWCNLISESLMSENHEISIGYFSKIIGNIYEHKHLLENK